MIPVPSKPLVSQNPMEMDIDDLLVGLEDVTINERIKQSYKELVNLYGERLPSDLQLSPEELIDAVNILQNIPIDASNQKSLVEELSKKIGKPQALKIGVSLVNISGGAVIASDRWSQVSKCVEELNNILHEKQNALEILQPKILNDYTNLVTVVGDVMVCAQLLLDSSIEKLSQTPSSNLVSLKGSPLLNLPLISEVPASMKKQALRILASRVVLAARVDSLAQGVTKPTQGEKWRVEVESKIDKLVAPPSSTFKNRALPKPTSEIKKRRGGQRYRKQKQKRAPSDLQQHQNVVKFG